MQITTPQIVQGAILVLSMSAAWMSLDKRQGRRLIGCCFGLAGQPFWLYATIHSEQWGMVALSCYYFFAWSRGIWNNRNLVLDVTRNPRIVKVIGSGDSTTS